MENSKGSKGIYEQMKEQATVFDPSKFSLQMMLDCLKAMDKRDQEYRKNNPPVIEIPMYYALELTCEQLKAHADSKHNYRFVGGLDAYEKLVKKCDDCGIKY